MNEYLINGAAVGLLVGYIVGRLDFLVFLTKCSDTAVATTQTQVAVKPRSFFDLPEETAKRALDIDTRKFVNPVKTDDLTKAADTSLGKTTVANDDIQASVSKLAQLKGK
jgi:hypothetical protein